MISAPPPELDPKAAHAPAYGQGTGDEIILHVLTAQLTSEMNCHQAATTMSADLPGAKPGSRRSTARRCV